jgi:HD-like signal output (HDOD) protein/CheY-like chemotaxis protein
MAECILFVDDEPQILKSLEGLFINTNYVIFLAESAELALNILAENKIDIIVSDMKMPQVDGYQLLSQVREKYPNVLRVILSGYADEKLVFKALQKNIVKLYIFKPWDDERLVSIIEHLLESERMLLDKNLLSIINNIEELPTIKANYQRILNLIEHDVDILQVSKEIEKDQSIAMKILHVANSAFFGIKTGSVRQAVSYIGLQNTRNLVITTSILNTMSSSGLIGNKIEGLWKKAFLASKMLTFVYEKHLGKKLPEVAMSSGLLYDIGIVFFLKCYPEKYLKMLKRNEKEKLTLNEIEMNEFSVNHSKTGGYLLKWWDLPFPIMESALFHHTPLDSRIVNKELVCAIHLVQKYTNRFDSNIVEDVFYEEVFEILGINKEDFEESLQEFEK